MADFTDRDVDAGGGYEAVRNDAGGIEFDGDLTNIFGASTLTPAEMVMKELEQNNPDLAKHFAGQSHWQSGINEDPGMLRRLPDIAAAAPDTAGALANITNDKDWIDEIRQDVQDYVRDEAPIVSPIIKALDLN